MLLIVSTCFYISAGRSPPNTLTFLVRSAESHPRHPGCRTRLNGLASKETPLPKGPNLHLLSFGVSTGVVFRGFGPLREGGTYWTLRV